MNFCTLFFSLLVLSGSMMKGSDNHPPIVTLDQQTGDIRLSLSAAQPILTTHDSTHVSGNLIIDGPPVPTLQLIATGTGRIDVNGNVNLGPLKICLILQRAIVHGDVVFTCSELGRVEFRDNISIVIGRIINGVSVDRHN